MLYTLVLAIYLQLHHPVEHSKQIIEGLVCVSLAIIIAARLVRCAVTCCTRGVTATLQDIMDGFNGGVAEVLRLPANAEL